MAITLSSISSTRRVRPPRVVIVGEGKIGKTTFATMAPNPIGILTEEGADNLDAKAFPMAQSLAEVYEAIGVLMEEDHDFQTLFIDSLDWMEPLVYKEVCARNNWASIETPGYGKGYTEAATEWRQLLHWLDELRAKRNMGIILIAHDKVKTINDPMIESYDSHVMKLNDRAGALVTEWADVIGFAGYRLFMQEKKLGFGQKETKAKTTGERLLHVEPHPAHCGGNRFGMRDMALDWNVFAANFAAATGAGQ